MESLCDQTKEVQPEIRAESSFLLETMTIKING